VTATVPEGTAAGDRLVVHAASVADPGHEVVAERDALTG
jgi:hypothetical protein